MDLCQNEDSSEFHYKTDMSVGGTSVCFSLIHIDSFVRRCEERYFASPSADEEIVICAVVQKVVPSSSPIHLLLSEPPFRSLAFFPQDRIGN